MRYDRSVSSRLMSDLMSDFGLTRSQAAGVVGNLAHESGGFYTLQERGYQRYGKRARGGYGYAQWTGPRRRAFEKWSANKGLPLDSYAANYGFLKHELKTTYKRALGKIKNAKTARQAAIATEKHYEQPGTPHRSSRLAYTKAIEADANIPTPTPRPNSPTEQAQMVAASRDSMLQGGLLGFDGRQSAQTWAAPAGTVERGLLAAPVQADIAPAGTMAVALDAMPTGSVERQSIAPPVEPTFQANVAPAGSMVASLPAAPAGAVETGGLLAPATNPAIGTPGDFNSLARATPANPGLLDQPDTNPYASVGVTDEQFAEMQAGVPQPATPMPATAPVTRPQTMQPTPPIGALPPAPVVAQPQIAPVQPQVAPAPQASGYAPAMEAQRQAQSVPSGMHAIGGLFGAPEGAMAVSRSNPGISFSSLGNGYVEKTNQYGHKSILSPGDYSFPTTPGPQANYSMASATGIPSGVQAPEFDQMETGGFLGIPEARSRLGQTVRGSLGGAAGAAVGGLLGPVGAVLGGLVGRELAQGNNPMDAFSRQQTSALNTGFRPGDVDLFPAAPSMSRYRGPEGGGDYSHADWDSLSESTRDAISNSPGGLY
ncbi:phage tail tip lysozyme [Nitratireductor sp. ac15]